MRNSVFEYIIGFGLLISRVGNANHHKMKIKVFTVSKNYFFHFHHILKVYCCSAKTSTNERFRVYYKLTDGTTETVQIGSPENLLWPASEISNRNELKPQIVPYQAVNADVVKYDL